MKKLLTVFTAGLMLVGLAACDEKPQPEPEKPVVNSVTLNLHEATIDVSAEKTVTLTATVDVTAQGDSTVTWYVVPADKGVTVANGVVTAADDVVFGDYTVLAISNLDATKSDRCEVTVLDSTPEWKEPIDSMEAYVASLGLTDVKSLNLDKFKLLFDIDFDNYEIEYGEDEDEAGEYAYLEFSGIGSGDVGDAMMTLLLYTGWRINDADEEDYDAGYSYYDMRSDFEVDGRYLHVAIETIASGSLYDLFYGEMTNLYVWLGDDAINAEDTAEFVNSLLGEGLADEDGYIALSGLGYDPEKVSFLDADELALVGDWFLVDYELGGNYVEEGLAKYAKANKLDEPWYDEDYDQFNVTRYVEVEDTEDTDALVTAAVAEVEVLEAYLPDGEGLVCLNPETYEEGEVEYYADAEEAYGLFYNEENNLLVEVETYYTDLNGGTMNIDLWVGRYGFDYVSSISVRADDNDLAIAAVTDALESKDWTVDDRYAKETAYLATIEPNTEEDKYSKAPYVLFFNNPYEEYGLSDHFYINIMAEVRQDNFNKDFVEIFNDSDAATVFEVAFPEIKIDEKDWNAWSSYDVFSGIQTFEGFDRTAVVGEGEEAEELEGIGEAYLALYNFVSNPENGWVLEQEEEPTDDDDDLDLLTLAAEGEEDSEEPVTPSEGEEEEEAEVPATFLAYSEKAYLSSGFYSLHYVVVGITEGNYTQIIITTLPDTDESVAALLSFAKEFAGAEFALPEFDNGTESGYAIDLDPYSVDEDLSFTLTITDLEGEADAFELRDEFLALFDEESGWTVSEEQVKGVYTVTCVDESGQYIGVIEVYVDRDAELGDICYAHFHIEANPDYQPADPNQGE